MAISAITGATINNATAGTSLAFASFSCSPLQAIVVGVAILTTTVSVSSITDTAGNTYVLATAVNNGTAVRAEIWVCYSTISNASNVITVNLSGSSLASAAFEEYAGVVTTSFGVTVIPVMTSNTTPSGIASASSSYATVSPWGAFNLAQPGWLTASGSTGWIQYQFSSAVTATAYSIIPWSQDTFPQRSPSAWQFQGSNNGTTWTTIDTRSGATPTWTQNIGNNYIIASPGSYAYYRLNITANDGDTYVGIKYLGISTATLVSLTANSGTNTGDNAYPEVDVVTQDGGNYEVCAIAVATTSGDTFTAPSYWTIRRSLVPALTTAAIALCDNTAIISTTMRAGALISAVRNWAAAGTELRDGTGALTVGGPQQSGPVKRTPTHWFPTPTVMALAGCTLGTAYSVTVSSRHGVSPYTYALTAGALPTGLSLAGSTGVISGTATALGTASFTITATDAVGSVGTMAFTLLVAAASGGGGSYTFVV